MPTKRSKRKKKRFPAGMEVQSLVFDANRFSRREARTWASEHGFKAPATERLETTIRVRQKSKGSFDESTFRTFSMGSGGVQAVAAVPKRKMRRRRKKRRS